MQTQIQMYADALGEVARVSIAGAHVLINLPQENDLSDIDILMMALSSFRYASEVCKSDISQLVIENDKK